MNASDDCSAYKPSSYRDQSHSCPRHHILPACIPSRNRHRRKNRKTQYAHASAFSPAPTGSTSMETQLKRKPQFGHSYLNFSSPNTSASISVVPVSSFSGPPLPSLSTGSSSAMKKKSNPSRSSPSSSISNFIRSHVAFSPVLLSRNRYFFFCSSVRPSQIKHSARSEERRVGNEGRCRLLGYETLET